jgi:nitrite reductase (NADH) small subunit
MEKKRFVVCPVSELPLGAKKIVDLGDRTIGVYNSRGTLYAVQNTCPHALAPICIADPSGTMLPSAPGEVKYGMEGLVLRCPWHNWEYDIRTGEALFGTDRRRLATFPVTVEDGQVVVTIRTRAAADARP